MRSVDAAVGDGEFYRVRCGWGIYSFTVLPFVKETLLHKRDGIASDGERGRFGNFREENLIYILSTRKSTAAGLFVALYRGGALSWAQAGLNCATSVIVLSLKTRVTIKWHQDPSTRSFLAWHVKRDPRRVQTCLFFLFVLWAVVLVFAWDQIIIANSSAGTV